MSISKVANHRFLRRLLKCLKNRYVLQRNTICAESCHEVPQKSFCATFFKKWQSPFCNFLQTTSFAQILRLLTEQQITGFRAACPMARKPLCVATQHDLRKILLRSAIKSFLVLFLEKEQKKCFFVTFFQKVASTQVLVHKLTKSLYIRR